MREFPPPERLVVLLHVPQNAMESYVLRTLPDLEIEPLEVHLFVCQECRDRFVTVLIAAETGRSVRGQNLQQ